MNNNLDIPEKFIARMRELLGDGLSAYLNALGMPAVKGLRVNTLKISADEFRLISPFELTPFSVREGFIVKGEKFGKNALHSAGLYYMQEPSAMTVAPLLYEYLDSVKNPYVLDLCAAPGGKCSQVAAYLNGRGAVVCNEYVFKRAQILLSNIERMGVTNALVTCARPDEIARTFGGAFDAIIADVPCSGEGMFRKGDQALLNWTESNVLSCAKRGAEILRSADECLKTGGLIAYSTCTFSKEENEQQCQSFAREYGYEILSAKRLYPHEFSGEGHFSCLMKKLSPQANAKRLQKLAVASNKKRADFEKAAQNCVHERFMTEKEFTLSEHNGGLSLVPKSLEFSVPLSVLRQGIRCADIAVSNRKPSARIELCHHLATVAERGKIKNETTLANEDDAMSYLSGNQIKTERAGMSIVTYLGYPLGWIKATDGIGKNRLPKGLRL